MAVVFVQPVSLLLLFLGFPCSMVVDLVVYQVPFTEKRYKKTLLPNSITRRTWLLQLFLLSLAFIITTAVSVGEFFDDITSLVAVVGLLYTTYTINTAMYMVSIHESVREHEKQGSAAAQSPTSDVQDHNGTLPELQPQSTATETEEKKGKDKDPTSRRRLPQPALLRTRTAISNDLQNVDLGAEEQALHTLWKQGIIGKILSPVASILGFLISVVTMLAFVAFEDINVRYLNTAYLGVLWLNIGASLTVVWIEVPFVPEWWHIWAGAGAIASMGLIVDMLDSLVAVEFNGDLPVLAQDLEEFVYASLKKPEVDQKHTHNLVRAAEAAENATELLGGDLYPARYQRMLVFRKLLRWAYLAEQVAKRTFKTAEDWLDEGYDAMCENWCPFIERAFEHDDGAAKREINKLCCSELPKALEKEEVDFFDASQLDPVDEEVGDAAMLGLLWRMRWVNAGRNADGALSKGIAKQIAEWCFAAIAANADLEAQDNNGRIHLSIAVQHGLSNVCLRLIEAGAGVNVKENGKTPLMYAAEKGDNDICRHLIEGKANVNLQDNYERTALMIAAEAGHNDVCLQLVAANADANIEASARAKTPLMVAAKQGWKDVCMRLIDAKADPNATESVNKKTALLYAAEQGHSDVCMYLIEAGAGVNCQDSAHNSPLMYAAENNLRDVCVRLINAKADVMATNRNGSTALMFAIEDGHNDVVLRLIEAKSYVDAKGGFDDKTPLICAVEKGLSDLCVLLIEAGADVNGKDGTDKTPLICAVEKDYNDVCVLLIKAGADVHAKDKWDRTPLFLAKHYHRDNLEQLLQNAGAGAPTL